MRTDDFRFDADALAEALFADPGIPRHTSFLVALSGGADSTALVHVLATMQRERALQLRALHVNHGLHRHADAWGGHCGRLCQALGVPLSIVNVSVTPRGRGMEAAAREARYAALRAVMHDGEVLLTAHHRDDQAETLLLNLLHGAGVTGLAAMAPWQRFGGGWHLRPLLRFRHAALVDYCRSQDLVWIEDSANGDLRLQRNWLRHAVMPRLAERVPRTDELLARSAAHMRDAMAVLDDVGNADLIACVLSASAGPTGFAAPLSARALAALSAPRQRNLLRYWMKRQGFEMPDAKKVEALRALAGGNFRAGHARVAFRDGQMGRFHDGLFLLPQFNTSPAGDMPWTMRSALALPGTGTQLRVETSDTGANGASLVETLRGRNLMVRLRRGGERVRLPGHKHRHSLKNLLHDHGMPPWWRERAPLVYANGELVAVANLAVSAPFAAPAGEPALRLIWERDATQRQ